MTLYDHFSHVFAASKASSGAKAVPSGIIRDCRAEAPAGRARAGWQGP